MSKLTTVRFTVVDFGDNPALVSQLIGFEPTGIATCGWSSLPKQTSWFAELPNPAPEKLEDHITALVRMLELHAEGVRKVAVRFQARIEISVDDRDYIWPYEPEGRFRPVYFDIPPETAAAISRLGLGISIHLTSGLEPDK